MNPNAIDCNCPECLYLRQRYGRIRNIKLYVSLEWPGLKGEGLSGLGIVKTVHMIWLAFGDKRDGSNP